MTIRPGTISRAKSGEPGMEYSSLRAEAAALVQAMAGETWSDYNYSDPGVTILEQLCYALTGLPYRASLPVREILSPPIGSTINLRRHALYPAWSMLPCNPVTADDLRRLVLDRVPGVGNVWFEPAEHAGLRGLYDVCVLAHGGRDGNRRLTERLGRCYARHRALCEDIAQVRLLHSVAATVLAEVEIGADADPSETLARAMFALGLFLAPQPKRMTLEQQVAGLDGTADVFSGPLMLRGFIASGQLGPRPAAISVSDLQTVLAETRGVVAVQQITAGIAGGEQQPPGQTITLPPHSIPVLNTTPADGQSGIRMTCQGKACAPDARHVHRMLDRLWSRQRQTYPLRTEYAARYPAPVAAYQDLSAYVSVQTQFPAVYGVGDDGLPPGATIERTAKARQLQGYLMPFDQLLADAFSQLAHVQTLFSVEAGGAATYATQSLLGLAPDAALVLAPGYAAGLAELSADTDPVGPRRNAVLDFLLSLYAGALTLPNGVPANPRHAGQLESTLIRAKQALLLALPALTRGRGRGGNYHRRRSRATVTGLEALSRLQLGLLHEIELEEAPASAPDRHWRMEADADAASFGRRLAPAQWRPMERHFRPIDHLDVESVDMRAADDSRSPLAGHSVAEALVHALAEPAHYRVRHSGAEATVVIACLDADGDWWLIAEHVDETSAARAIAALLRAARLHRRHRAHGLSLVIVEWVLLRAASLVGGGRHGDSFRITAVLTDDPAAPERAAWRRDAADILRTNTPAHILLDCLFLHGAVLARFEELHGRWAAALRGPDHHALARSSQALAVFLDRHSRHGPAAVPPPTPPATPAPTPAPAPAAGQEVPAATAAPVPAVPEGANRLQQIFTAAAVRQQLPVAPAPTPAPPAGGRASMWAPLWAMFGRRAAGPPPAAIPAPEPSSQPAHEPAPPPGTAVRAPAAAKGFDCDTVLTSETAQAFAAQGFVFAVRYLSLTVASAQAATGGNLTAQEALAILESGLALMAVQHTASSGWTPSQRKGAQYGAAAAANAKAAGLPGGVTIWLDLEGIKTGTAAETVTAYCSAWHGAVVAGGYLPGIYVGADCILNGSQLDELPFDYFWQSGSTVPSVARGYCMVQTIASQFSLDGVAYDLDQIAASTPDSAPFWVAPGLLA